MAKKLGITEQTLYAWRKRFRGKSVEDVKEFKALAAENAKLKKLVAEQLLALEVMKEANARMW